jgi:hypothetical protein
MERRRRASRIRFESPFRPDAILFVSGLLLCHFRDAMPDRNGKPYFSLKYHLGADSEQ